MFGIVGPDKISPLSDYKKTKDNVTEATSDVAPADADQNDHYIPIKEWYRYIDNGIREFSKALAKYEELYNGHEV